MGAIVELHHVNGGEIRCAYCKTLLGEERAVAHMPGGVRFFCKTDPEHPEGSCYLAYRGRLN